MKHLIVAMVIIAVLFSSGCATVSVTGKRFGSVPEDVRHFVQPSQVSLYPSIQAAWQALETGYRYQTDDWYIADRYGQSVPGGNDTWLMPSEVQVLIDAGGLHGLDCEDGAIWLTSALKKQGYDAWFCVGSVALSSGTWGHAWCMLFQNGTWILYETTTGQVVAGLPGEYRLNWRTNGQAVWTNVFSTGAWREQSPIPMNRISELWEVLMDSEGVS